MNKFKDYFSAAPKCSRVLFWALLVSSVILIITSFLIPPKGIIDSSVLAAVGEIMGFASIGMCFECIFCGFDVKMSKGDLEVEVSGKERTDD